MWEQLLLTFFGLFIAFYFYMTRNFGYFRSRGIPEVPSYFPFGSDEAWDFVKGKKSFACLVDTIYEQYKALPMVGYISMGKPFLVINDLELAKQIMIKDFDHFMDRRKIDLNENVYTNQIGKRMLTMMEGDTWKHMRGTLTPVFTSGKLKAMSKMINKVNNDLMEDLAMKADSHEEFDVKEIMVRYMSDAIASCGYGMETNSFKDSNSEFRKMVCKITGSGTGNKIQMIKLLSIIFVPKLAYLLQVSFFDEDATKFFVSVIKQTLAYRREHKTRRNDFIDLTLDALKNEMKYETESDQFEKDAEVKVTKKLHLSEEELEANLIANLFILFIAGFDTSSTTLATCSHFLAKNPDVQEKLYEEIMEQLGDIDDEDLDYNSVHSLPYLDMVVHETLRCYPITTLERKCTSDYKIPGTNFVVPQGMMVQFASNAIMRDPKYFPYPDSFNPENFSPENKANRSPYAFLAFGQGPRNCIGMRFALLGVKMCIVRLLKEFRLEPSANTQEKLIHDPLSQSASPIGGIHLHVSRR